MAYSSGTITSATPWAQISQKIKDLVGTTGVANWSFVENIPAGTGTGQSGAAGYSIDVFKCAGTGTNANSTGVDFYVALRMPVADGAVSSSAYLFEDYEGGANKRFRRPAAESATNAPTGSGFWRSDTYAAAASVVGARSLDLGAVNTSGFSYFLSLTNNSLILVYIVGSIGSGFWVSTGDTFVAPAIATDALIMGGYSSQPNLTYVTREPGITDAANSKWRYSWASWTPTIGSNASATDVDFFQQGKIISARQYLNRGGTTNGNVIGRLRGLMNSSLLCFNTGGTINVGDTIVINGVTYAVIDNGAGTNTNNPNFASGRVFVSPAT